MRCMDECKGRLSHWPISSTECQARSIGPDAAWEMAMQLGVGDEDATVVAQRRSWLLSLMHCGAEATRSQHAWRSRTRTQQRYRLTAWATSRSAWGIMWGADASRPSWKLVKRNLITSEPWHSWLLPHMAVGD